ncbi:MAG: hypothetical protein Kow00121_56850 [Elainellaceae cyanobacterium]
MEKSPEAAPFTEATEGLGTIKMIPSLLPARTGREVSWLGSWLASLISAFLPPGFQTTELQKYDRHSELAYQSAIG